MKRGFDPPELAAADRPKTRRWLMDRLLAAALGRMSGGEDGAVRKLQEEEDMDREKAERFVRHFRLYVDAMAAAIERTNFSPDGMPDAFAEEVRKRRGAA